MTLFLLICGLALLLAGGTALVTGASSVATRFGIPPLVVGMTILAFGTSSPELVVNVVGAIRGETELAFGNVSGSNLANLGLVLGLAALIMPVSIEGAIVRRELPLLLLGTTILLVMMLDQLLLGEAPVLTRADGLILLLLFSVF
ncbi:MAG: sodium:calcium antiporter, partial [Halioglobus sp.]|nr:sodium:calcium antiporter [Halioglobus sp.]